MDRNLRKLQEIYKRGDVVPFIGAGLSVPFNIPNWSNLIRKISDEYMTDDLAILKPSVDKYLEKNNFWKAIESVIDFADISEEDIQQEITAIINAEAKENIDDEYHNYKDIADMNFNIYLTTNYDHLLWKYMNGNSYIPLVLSEIDFNTQNLFSETKKRVFHLHGHISNPGTIIITKNQYETLYKDDKYENILKLITGTKSLLFLGFSFDDQFIRKLIKDHKRYFKGNHYILLDNPDVDTVKELKLDYGLNVIKYDSTKSNHVTEIRKILNIIKSDDMNNECNNNEVENLGGVSLADTTKDVAANLFYKKLLLEDIDEDLLELSTYYYLSADKYIHNLSKNKISKDLIEQLLFVVLLRYQEVLVGVYKEHGNSQEFVQEVHKILKGIDYGRLTEAFNSKNKPFDFENQGMIHMLADDPIYKVWWGDKRINEE